MAISTVVRFAHEDGALAGTLASLSDQTISTVQETSTAPGRDVYVFRFDGTRPDAIRAALEADHTVRNGERVAAVENGQLWAIEFTAATKLLGPAVTAEGGVVLDARSAPARRAVRGWRERWVFPDHEGIHNVWAHARSEGFEFDVLELSQRARSDAVLDGLDPLTEDQRAALVAAVERGYFREPREASLEELAEVLERSPSAVNGRLKRGLKSLVGSLLVTDEASSPSPPADENGFRESPTGIEDPPTEP